MNLFKSSCKLTTAEAKNVAKVEDLFQALVQRLNGYSLALELAATIISYITGLDTSDSLKSRLKKCIQSIDGSTQFWSNGSSPICQPSMKYF